MRPSRTERERRLRNLAASHSSFSSLCFFDGAPLLQLGLSSIRALSPSAMLPTTDDKQTSKSGAGRNGGLNGAQGERMEDQKVELGAGGSTERKKRLRERLPTMLKAPLDGASTSSPSSTFEHSQLMSLTSLIFPLICLSSTTSSKIEFALINGLSPVFPSPLCSPLSANPPLHPLPVRQTHTLLPQRRCRPDCMAFTQTSLPSDARPPRLPHSRP
jgi:hypothetical protein